MAASRRGSRGGALRPWSRSAAAGGIAALSILSQGVPAAAAGDDTEWSAYNHRLSGVRYSGLAQISTANVGDLQEVCRLPLAHGGSLSAGRSW
jgi:glucose dehydrogenase